MTKPIRVAMLSHDYLPKGGGIETQIAAIAPMLQTEHHTDVHIITRKYPDLAASEVINGIQVHRIAIPTGNKALASIKYTSGAMAQLRQLQPDLVHAHSYISPTTTALLDQFFTRRPVVLTSHRSGYLGDVQRLRRRKLGDTQFKWMRDRISAFVTISEEIGQELDEVGIPRSKQHYIPNGVDTDRFTPLPPDQKRELRQTLGLPETGPIVIFTGRLDPEKRVNHLLTVWPGLRETYPDATLCILGTGQLDDELKAMAGEGVIFTGRVSNVPDYLKASDIFVLPSIAEGLSVAMLEAMATGLPAVITTVGGAPDVITHEENGWLITPDDVEDLRTALDKLLGDSTLREQVGNAARDHIQREYKISVIAGRWRKLYDTVLATHQS